MKRITVNTCSAGFDLYQEARNYMTEIFTISLVPEQMTSDPPTLKKAQRIWAIWKSGQNCIGGGQSPLRPPRGGANAYTVFRVKQ